MFFSLRNNFFIKNPGRYVGGVFGFMSGFRGETWIACSVLLVSLPALLAIFHVILERSNLTDNTNWSYGWNFFVFSAAIAQQVIELSQYLFIIWKKRCLFQVVIIYLQVDQVF